MAYLNEDGLETLVGKIKGQVIELTSAEYRQLPATKNTDNKLYFVNDEAYAYQIDDEPTSGSSGLVKSGGVYNWTSKIGSGTLTTTAQTLIPAVNELNAEVDELNNGLTRNKKGTTVNLSNSTTDYTFPSDGYLIVSTSSTANAVAIVDLRDSTSSYIGTVGGQGNSNYPSWATFVRAGMIVRIRTVSNSGYVAFVPLVS